MAAKLSDVTSALGGGTVQDLTETELISFIGTLASVLVDTVDNEHDDEGEHTLEVGTLSERPTAATAGKVYVANTDAAGADISTAPTVYIDNGTAWTNVTDLSSARLIYTNAQHTALIDIAAALDFILNVYNASGTVKGSEVIVTPTSPQVLPEGGTLDDLATTVDGLLDEQDAAKMPVDYGSTMTLQAAITSIKNSLTSLATPINWDSGDFDHILETDTTWTSIIQRLDNAIRKTGVDYTSISFKHTPTLGSGIYGDAEVTLKAILDSIESATAAYADTQLLTVFFAGDVDTTIAATTDGWAHAWLIPEDPTGSGVLGDVYVDQFYAKVVTQDDDATDDVEIVFRKNTFSGTPTGAPSITISVGNSEAKYIAASIAITAEYDYIGVRLVYVDSDATTTASDLMVSCRLVKLRNMSDW